MATMELEVQSAGETPSAVALVAGHVDNSDHNRTLTAINNKNESVCRLLYTSLVDFKLVSLVATDALSLNCLECSLKPISSLLKFNAST